MFILPAFTIPSGEGWNSGVDVLDAATMPPGHYRVVKTAKSIYTRWPDGVLIVYAEFDVVSPDGVTPPPSD